MPGGPGTRIPAAAAGLAPSGTGFVKVVDGVLQTPAALSDGELPATSNKAAIQNILGAQTFQASFALLSLHRELLSGIGALGAGATGYSSEITGSSLLGLVVITYNADQSSASNGVVLQASLDGTNWGTWQRMANGSLVRATATLAGSSGAAATVSSATANSYWAAPHHRVAVTNGASGLGSAPKVEAKCLPSAQIERAILTQTPLTGGGTYTSDAIDMEGRFFVQFMVESDVAGASLNLEHSTDGSNWVMLTTTGAYVVGTVGVAMIDASLRLSFRYIRAIYTNGATPQTRFNLLTAG